MRRSILALAMAALVTTGVLGAQRSPRTTNTGVVDGVNISIEYGAPSKRGRVIWSGLRPWGEWWMPGADAATTMTTSGPLMVAGTMLVPAGEHTIYTIPGVEKFLLMINTRTGQFHTQYNPDLDLGHVPMTLTMLTEPVEKMTLAVDADPAGGGHLKLIWDDREYSVAIAAPKVR